MSLPNAASLLNRLLARGKLRQLQVLLQLAELGSVQRTAAVLSPLGPMSPRSGFCACAG